MATSRPSKRQRTGGAQTSYHDLVPLPEDLDFSVVQASEGRLKNVGGILRTALLERMAQHTTDSWRQVTMWDTPDNTEFALDPSGDLYNAALEAEVMDELDSATSASGEKKRKSRLARRPHVVWKELHRQAYLDEILRLSGRGDFRSVKDCPDCLSRSAERPGTPEYRCDECFMPDLTCGACCVRRHRLHPLHRIKKWTGSHFIKASLKSLGLKIQLNHSSMFCENPIPAHASLLLLHTNGIHEVDIRYCGCSRAIPQHLQLLRRRLYPGSQLSVKTCATFELLKNLHMLALTTKASTYDFYRALEKTTSNTGMAVPKSRYRALFRIILQWRHLQMLKWAGRGNDVSGVAGTQSGDLAIRCPSCPHPGINLLDGWEDAPDGMRFLYMVFICMDANFRLKNQLVSNYSQDPGLGIGWAYMVPRQSYEAYVLSRANDEDISTCVGLQALAKANTKFSVGLRYTGVNVAVCGRSEMIFPCGVGNLQKGERYANMDYIFGFVLRFIHISLILISYDICCQWFINLFTRMEHWPPEIKLRSGVSLIPAIPKLHEPMHQTKNHEVYSLNYIKGCGHSDCECPERVWAPHNPLANSTKTQGPGSRQDVLDDHFGFWNWLKYVGLGVTLLRKYKAAVADRNLQQEGHRGLTESLDQELVKSWEKMCVDWEQDAFPKKRKNPYYNKDAHLSEAQVKKALAEEEEKRLAAGGASLHNTSAAGFIQMGLDLEDTQRRLRRLAKAIAAKSEATIGQEKDLTQDRNGLRLRLRAWEQLVPIYMPGLLQFQLDLVREAPPHQSATKSAMPEDSELWLPSSLPESARARICVPGLPAIEERLRDAQCADSLRKVQRVLKVKARMVYFKNKNVRGQRGGTRSRAIIERVHMKARYAADRYRGARQAKLALAGPGKWEEAFRVLEDRDIRGYQDPNHLGPRVGRLGTLEDDQVERQRQSTSVAPSGREEGEFELFNETRSRRDGTGETRRTLSWIWLTMPSTGGDDDSDDILRVEWAKSRARAMRGMEEVMLLKEEMRRVLAFLEWKSGWWKGRQAIGEGSTKELGEGIRAFALGQSSLQQDLATHFRELWKTPLADLDGPELGETAEEHADDDDNEDGGDENEEDEIEDEPLSDDELGEVPSNW